MDRDGNVELLLPRCLAGVGYAQGGMCAAPGGGAFSGAAAGGGAFVPLVKTVTCFGGALVS